MAVHTTQAEFVIRLADEDRILLRQLIDRLANPVAPTWPGGATPTPTPAPQWWQNPVICDAGQYIAPDTNMKVTN